MSKPTQREQVQKGLQHLKGSDKIVGDIVAYCVQAYKAEPSQKTIEKVRKYVEDTANSVSDHVLTIAHNLNRIIESETKEIEDLSFKVGYVSHRLTSHQRYMSELFMTKFQTFPRPRPTIHILRQAIPENQLPRYARRKRPWQRQTGFDYKILDQVGAKQRDTTNTASNNAEPAYGPSGVSSPSASSMNGGFGKSTIKPFNPYESNPSTPVPSNNNKSNQASQNAPPQPKGPTLFQRSQNNGFGFNTNFSQPPPSFGGGIDANVGSRGPSASVVHYVGGDDDMKNAGPPPPVPPSVPDIPPMSNNNGPPQPPQPPGPPQPPQPPQASGPPPVPNFGASFAANNGPPQPPQPPQPPMPAFGGGGPPPPIPPMPNQSDSAQPGPPPPPPN